MNFTSHHIAISAANLQESINFYEEFGFKLVLQHDDPEGAFKIAHLKLDTTFLEIFWYRDRIPAPETAAALSTDLPRVGVKHFGLRVDSVYDAKKFVESRGLATNVQIKEGKTGITYFFLKDPSGILVEVLEDKRGL